MKKILTYSVLFLTSYATMAQWEANPVDANATDKTVALYRNLKDIAFTEDQFLFGQEFANSYNTSGLSGNPWQSECEDVVGDHPAVLGSDFFYYLKDNGAEKSTHLTAVQKAYNDFGEGAIITFDWHMPGPGGNTNHGGTNTSFAYDVVHNTSNGYYNNDSDGDANKIHGKTPRDWFYDRLKEVRDIINDDLWQYKDGSWHHIPIVFRLFHEMNGSWFWWGKDDLSAADYISLYQMTAGFLKSECSTVLFCWSPDMFYTKASWGRSKGMDYYPGDDYVDILGLDAYNIGDAVYPISEFRDQMRAMSDNAWNKQKIAVLAETGYKLEGWADFDGSQPWHKPWTGGNYWQDRVLDALVNDPQQRASKIAWVLTWINSPWASQPYVSIPSHPNWAKIKLNDFEDETSTLFASNVPNMYAYTSGAWSRQLGDVADGENQETDVWSIELSVYPNPTRGMVNFTFSDHFAEEVAIRLYNGSGQLVLTETANFSENKTKQLNLSRLTTGHYYYEVHGSKILRGKLMVR
ncbi:MAG: glycosyl hydrolase [Reichenbachiella sp.]|uniref:glycosyl hydrolase n=4 Tax=Reichenbachiella sp. TaxID=2184521 RepID=UPI0032651FFE